VLSIRRQGKQDVSQHLKDESYLYNDLNKLSSQIMQLPNTRTIVADEYNDNWIDRLFIWLFSRKISQALGAGTTVGGYGGFVDLSQQVTQGRNARAQQALIAQVLQSLVPAPVLWAIRTFSAPTRLVCVLNAWFATQMFIWLVGPCEVAMAEVDLPDGTVRSQSSAVQIKKCRYLVESSCVGTCVNLCKVPTQNFFTEKFGIPLTMTPNFEDFSCKMIFGQLASPMENDEVYRQPCLTDYCPTASAALAACPKLT
jgi:Beta-carotene isomerase D27-like, C-terminal